MDSQDVQDRAGFYAFILIILPIHVKFLSVNVWSRQKIGQDPPTPSLICCNWFGFNAKGEARLDSDLDFVVEFKSKSFDAYMDLKFFLEDLYGCRVDLATKDSLKPRLRSSILEETAHAPGL